MGVYIKGMEMPQLGCEVIRVHPDGTVTECPFPEYPGYEENLGKAVPIPPPGRLKKRIVYRGEVYDALEAARIESLDGILTDPYKEGFHDGLKRALQILANKVKDAPVIIMEEEADCHTSDSVTGSQ